MTKPIAKIILRKVRIRVKTDVRAGDMYLHAPPGNNDRPTKR